MHSLRSVLSTLAVTGLALGAVATAAAPATAYDGPPVAPAAGRLLSTTDQGIVAVDDDGSRTQVVVPARNGHTITLLDVSRARNLFLWRDEAAGGGIATYHVSNLYGDDLHSFWIGEGTTRQAALSGDGHTVYYEVPGGEGGNAAVYRTSTDGPYGGETSLVTTSPGERAGSLRLSPDGTELAYLAGSTSGASSVSAVHVVDVDGSHDRTFPAPQGSSLSFGDLWWSPDSQRVVTSTNQQYDNAASILDTTTGEWRHVSVYGAVDEWAPDGAIVGINSLYNGFLARVYPTDGRSERVGTTGRYLSLGALSTDQTAPSVAVQRPVCPAGTADCRAYRHSTAGWTSARGRVSDTGSGERYVVVTAVRHVGQRWFALVGQGDAAAWQRFATGRAARQGATERNAAIQGHATWSIDLPGVRRGDLTVTAKAADWAGNVASAVRTTTLD